MTIKKNDFCLLLCLWMACSPLLAQESPYHLDLKKDLIILGIGTSTLATRHYIQKNLTPLTEAEVFHLKTSDVWSIDRPATNNWSPRAGKASDIFLYASVAMPITLVAAKKTRSEAGKIGLLFLETMIINQATTDLIKGTAHRLRPFAYNLEVPIERRASKGARLSLISGHTSGSAAGCFFAAKVFSDYYPNSKLKPYIWAVAAALPAVTGYLRYAAGKHYFTDVLMGYTTGALIGYFIPHIHKRPNRNFTLIPSVQSDASSLTFFMNF